MRARARFVLVAALVLGGCFPSLEYFTGAAFKELMQPWVGRTADDIVLAWGPPEKQFTLDSGDTLLLYILSETRTYGGNWTTDYDYDGNIVGGHFTPVETSERRCDITVVVGTDRRISKLEWDGVWCQAYELDSKYAPRNRGLGEKLVMPQF